MPSGLFYHWLRSPKLLSDALRQHIPKLSVFRDTLVFPVMQKRGIIRYQLGYVGL